MPRGVTGEARPDAASRGPDLSSTRGSQNSAGNRHENVRGASRQGLPPLAITAGPFGAKRERPLTFLRPEGAGGNSRGGSPWRHGDPVVAQKAIRPSSS